MSNERELPSLRGENLYIPFVGAIIERETDGKKQILVQVREKEEDKVYSGSIEIPGGKFRAFEDIYETVRRETREESGLDVTFIEGEDRRIDYPNRENTSTLLDPFCVTQMRDGPFIGIIFRCKAEGVPVQKTNETKEARWMDIEELRRIVNDTPERVYTAFLGALKKYVEMNS